MGRGRRGWGTASFYMAAAWKRSFSDHLLQCQEFRCPAESPWLLPEESVGFQIQKGAFPPRWNPSAPRGKRISPMGEPAAPVGKSRSPRGNTTPLRGEAAAPVGIARSPAGGTHPPDGGGRDDALGGCPGREGKRWVRAPGIIAGRRGRGPCQAL